MNSKLLKGSLAGVAALALAAGGTTFAAWSDFGTESTGAGAGILRLDIGDRDGAGKGIEPFSLAPGQNKYQEFFLASANANNVPNGTLYADLQNLADIEDNGPNCTTNSEKLAEGGVDCGTTGELSGQAKVQVLYSDPVASASSCPNTGIYSHSASVVGDTLASFAAKPRMDLGVLSKGEGVCVRMEMSLPISADNKVQGDDVTFDWRFDLEQVTS